MKKSIYKWLSALLVAALVLIGFGGDAKVALASEERVWNYEYEGYSVEYVSYSDWGTGCNGAIILTNQTSENIKDWELSFDYDREITDISNAVIVSQEQGHYVIKNAEYNTDIAGYESIYIVFVAGEGQAKEIPENFSLRQTTTDESSSGTVDEIIEKPKNETFFDEENVVIETMMVDEMAFVSWLMNSTDEELLESGYTEEEVYEIRNYNYSDDILALQAFTRDELGEMGYDENQIEGIYGYAREDDAIQYASAYGLSKARLTVTYYVKQKVARQSVEIWYEAEWNMCPIFTATDCIAIGWVACDSNSQPIVMSVLHESHNADYYSMWYDTVSFCDAVKYTKKSNYRLLDVDMSVLNSGSVASNEESFYPKKIWGYIALKTAANSFNLNNIIVTMGYSHTIIGTSASIGVDMNSTVSMSLSFNWRAEELYSDSLNFLYNGTVSY